MKIYLSTNKNNLNTSILFNVAQSKLIAFVEALRH